MRHRMAGHGEMAWMGESIGRDGHRMIVEVPVYTVSNVSDVSERTSVGFGSGVEGSVMVW